MPELYKRMSNYKISQEIMDRIPTYFYTAMAGELFSVFGWELSRSLFYTEKEQEYADLISSSEGWVQAFKATCGKLDMQWLIDYYDSLEWFESDVFDGIIEQMIWKQFMKVEDEPCNDYYQYLISREDDT